MTMPVMEPDLDATVLQNWARAIDEGPFSSLCWGERIAFDNPDSLTLLGALAAWTDRVRLVTTVIVPQLRDPVMLAKASVALVATTRERLEAMSNAIPPIGDGNRIRVGRFEVDLIVTRDGRRLAAFWPVDGGEVMIVGEATLSDGRGTLGS
jgi:hypothetical protein